MNKKTLFIIIVITNQFVCKAQITDSTWQLLSAILKSGYEDTSDIEDFYYVDSNNVSEPGGNGDGQYCRKHYLEKAHHDINLVPAYPYIEVFSDEFRKLDKNLWLNPSTNFNYFVTWADADYDSHNQAMYLNDNVSILNEKLVLETKEENKVVGWLNHRYWPWPTIDGNPNNPTPQKTIKYTSARVQSRWSFDGNFEFADGDAYDDEGGIIVEAKIKYPTVNGTFPAFWMMGYAVNDYDEFDIFEFFENIYDVMWSSLYKKGSNVDEFRCSESSSIDEIKDKFYYYYFVWNRQFIGIYVSEDQESFTPLYIRHQFARNNRIGGFQDEIQENEYYRRRMQYCSNPMRINFNTAVHPPGNLTISENLSAKYEIESIKVYKEIKCPNSQLTKYSSKSDFDLRPQVYNVLTAKKAEIDLPTNNIPDILSGECVKIICEDNVILNRLNVHADGEFRIEHQQDVCSNSYPLSSSPIGISEVKLSSDYSNSVSSDVPVLVDSRSINDSNSYLTVSIFDLSGRKLETFSKSEWNNHAEIISRFNQGTYVAIFLNEMQVFQYSQLIFFGE